MKMLNVLIFPDIILRDSMSIQLDQFALVGGSESFFHHCGTKTISAEGVLSTANQKVIKVYKSIQSVLSMLTAMDNLTIAGIVRKTEYFEKNDVHRTTMNCRALEANLDAEVARAIVKENNATEGVIMWMKSPVRDLQPPPILLKELVVFFRREENSSYISSGYHVCDLIGKSLDAKYDIVAQWIRNPSVSENLAGVQKQLGLSGLWQLSNIYYPDLIPAMEREKDKRKTEIEKLKNKGKIDEARKLEQSKLSFDRTVCSTFTATTHMTATAKKVFAEIRDKTFFVVEDGSKYACMYVLRLYVYIIVPLHTPSLCKFLLSHVFLRRIRL